MFNDIITKDAGTMGAAVAFCLDNFTGALRVQNDGAAHIIYVNP